MSETSQNKPQVKVKATRSAKKAPAQPKQPKTVTYRMTRPGQTEGASGKVYKHVEAEAIRDNKKVKVYTCTVPEGEFDHLINEDGSSKYIVTGKL